MLVIKYLLGYQSEKISRDAIRRKMLISSRKEFTWEKICLVVLNLQSCAITAQIGISEKSSFLSAKPDT